MPNFSISLHDIRPLNGKQAEGLEELCTQLARLEPPSRSRFVRKGAPDAGVECFAVLEDSSEWGWQVTLPVEGGIKLLGFLPRPPSVRSQTVRLVRSRQSLFPSNQKKD